MTKFIHFPLCFFFFVAEIEAIEACKWLRAAGFPQYAQMYEGKCTTTNQNYSIEQRV